MCIQSSVIGGVVFYEKYTRFTTFEWVCLPIALACTFNQFWCALATGVIVDAWDLTRVVIPFVISL